MKYGKNTAWKLKSLCDKSDKYFREKANEVGGFGAMSYYLPYYRTIIASHYLAEMENGLLIWTGDPIACIAAEQKYISYLSFFERIDLMKALLNPIFDYCESGRWSACYPPSDLGHYPFALHQIDKIHRPIESASAMLAVSSVIADVDASWKYVLRHQKILRRWANYVYNTSTLEEFPCLYNLSNTLIIK